MTNISYTDTVFTRARDYYLYSHGTRYVDLDLCRGRSPFGHKPNGLHLRIKQDLSRGLWGTVNNRWAHRLLKSIHATFSECRCYAVYCTEYELLDTYDIIDIFNSTDLLRYKQAYDTSTRTHVIFRWYPFGNIPFSTLAHQVRIFAQEHNDAHGSKHPKVLIMPVIPFPLSPSIAILLTPDSDFDESSYETVIAYINQNISPVFTAGICYAVNLLRIHGMDVRPIVRKISKRSDLYSICKAFSKNQLCKHKILELPSPSWKQYGIYIRYPTITDINMYKMMREIFFAHGFYISATAGMITLPPYFTAQELKKWYSVIEAVRAIKEIQSLEEIHNV